MRALALFRPRLRVASILDVNPATLRAGGIRGIVLDLDNTLLPYGSREVPSQALQWVREVRGAGLEAVLVTNNRSRRARGIAEAMEIPIASGWAKPSRSMLRRAMALMGTMPEETAVIGDQLLTDILAGNRCGCYTILVTPIGKQEFPATRLVSRVIEGLLLRLLRVPPAARRT